MGVRSSKTSKAHSRSTTDSNSSYSNDQKQYQSQPFNEHKDPAGSSDTNSTSSRQDSSQLTGEASSVVHATSPLSSKTNLSSFLSSFRHKSRDKDSTDSNDNVHDSEKKDEGDPRLIDLREQIEQKKVNKMNQKTQKQQGQPTIPDNLSSVSSSFISAPHSLDNSLRLISSKASSVNAAYVSSKNTHSTTPPNAFPSQQSRTSKLDFIRSKASFAWLEKKLFTSSNSNDKALSNNSADSQQGQLLDKMELEAANGYFDRITDQHFLMKDVMGGNYHIPMDLTFKRVLENGCGAGDWTLDMASEMPETDFVGCPQITYTTSPTETSTPTPRPRGLLGADLSQQGSTQTAAASTTSAKLLSPLIRPSIRPRNCNFNTEVPINRLPYSDEQFDFVYQRRQGIVLMSTEWQRTILELFRVTKSGGWIEILEPDQFLRGGGELCQLAGEYCVALFESMGRNPNVVYEMQQLLEGAGFVNVTAKVWSIPVGWGGPTGEAMLANQRQFVNELEPIYVRQGHGESQEFREITKGIFEEAVEKKAYINYHVFVAQKPASASERQAHQQRPEESPSSLPQQQDPLTQPEQPLSPTLSDNSLTISES
ncbi:hypothetical protein BGZ80_004339 [Entomortierella chlamydospora]|uniref:Methyltransferase domain-containing protein n=1 Tax=Entomortierella chlamydospora TaxID=101097 RepID=A0A9P6T342_9FUNG|nr:hypothetical protein BGZ79_004779 [Entomortierella chlamydospora]KAG0020370.1 hypothetical protein BGZ80_004339 [Entomortierella chlamydospora]